MMEDLYDALKSAGADDGKARKAATEAATYDTRIADLRGEIIGVRDEIGVVRWMLGFNLAMTVALVGKTFLSAH